MTLVFCCSFQILDSEVYKEHKNWINPTLCQQFRLLVISLFLFAMLLAPQYHQRINKCHNVHAPMAIKVYPIF